MFYEDEGHLDFHENINESIEKIEAVSTEDSVGYMRFIDKTYEKYKISDEMISIFPLFTRFANLYGYARILLSVKEKWDNEPEWLVNLRMKLNNTLKERRSMFGSVIE